MTSEEYEKAIPKCCAYQKLQSHLDMMLCWSLAHAVENGEEMNCGDCELNTLRKAQEK